MKKSLDPAAIFYLIISAIELSVGVVANGYIVALNCIDWAKSRTLSSYDKIITGLAFSRFCLQFLVTLNNISSKVYQNIFDRFQILQPYLVIWMFINQVSLCFASCLSVFYCVKIATFNQSLCSCLKLKISKLVPWLLWGSVLYCLVTTVAFTLFSYSYCVSSHNSTDRLSTNSTISDNINNLLEFTFLIHSVGSIFPLILFIASSVLLIISLWRHIRKMNLNSDLNQNFRNPNTDAHMRALRSVVSFFIVYNIYYVASTFPIGNPSYFNDEWKYTVCIFIAAAYPSVHSIILILGNPKLKLASANILNSANSCFRKVTS
ncbi:taste receptor type 2 member 40-like [Malaclemys terrapin pileata]|uniref:taste receptor type 2 member 40-like n=1 Tax=Malaclemys terrapin pileata TaxID=2991368 RepID=UPI0023A7FBA6|nr:taste receptor type 2 member 40-like [Malaclemys terrapin pileata]